MDRREFIKLMILMSGFTYLGTFSGCGGINEEEIKEIKDRLNIPSDAKKVLFLSQSSHWDINWQKTFDEYYDQNVEKIILNSIEHLKFDNMNHYSISKIHFRCWTGRSCLFVSRFKIFSSPLAWFGYDSRC